MADPQKRRATYADLETAPPHLVAEIIDGELVTSRHLGPRDGMAANLLALEIGRYAHGVGAACRWTFMLKPEVHFGSDVLVPDLAGWQNLKSLPERWADMAVPYWVCEVLSPATETYDRGSKRRIYASAGVRHLWLLDSRTKLLDAFALTDDDWILSSSFCESDTVNAPPFNERSFDLDELWPLDAPDRVARSKN